MARRLCLGLLAAAFALGAAAQDTQYAPRNQQIPVPECMNLHFAWESTAVSQCPPFIHERWLRDIHHWRDERRIRTTFDPARY